LSVLESISHAVVVCNRKSEVIFANSAAKELCGGDPLSTPFERAFPLLLPATCPATDGGYDHGGRAAFMSDALQNLPVRSARAVFVSAAKKKVDLLVDANPILSPKGEVEGCVTTMIDVTVRKGTIECVAQERSMERQLLQKQKMETMGALAGGIAHDFNNILAAIIGFTELADDDIPDECRAHEYLGEVFKAGRRATSLVNQILAFSHQGGQKKKPIQITAIVREVIKMLRASIPSTIEIKQNLESKLDTILADPTQIHQVLLNLCTNAAHAMADKGGNLKVSLIDVEFDEETATLHPDLKTGPYVALSVRDTGHGIDPEVVDRIFDPFFSTKKPGIGTGMGLSVAHGIVREHGGVITVFSEPERGSTFNVYFPRVEFCTKATKEEPSPLPVGTETILFVDDEKMLSDMTRRILERLGYKVATRTSSVEALQAFKANPDRYDLVITDQTMPNMTGTKLAKEILKIRPGIPIILCTGFSELITDKTVRSIGIRELLLKPIVRNDLAHGVRRVLDRRGKETK
jgi:two-component system, cell cycle sensor histidine kinase and response regulator CckA